jgi:hypothetical protein
MKQEDRDVALDSRHFRAPGSRNFINISTLDESDKQVFNTIFYKEIPMGEDETLIVTYFTEIQSLPADHPTSPNPACPEID